MQSYHQLLTDILRNGELHEDRTGVGTLSVFGRQWRHSLEDGFPLITTKYLPFRWIAEELFWFLSGSTDEGDLRERGVDIWKEWATVEACAKFGRSEGDMGPIYGGLWRSFPVGFWPDGNQEPPVQIDQIRQLINDVQNNPNSRRLIVTGWHPYYQSRVSLPPCHTLFQLKVHANRSMSLHMYQRSADAFLGVPFNIASYALLLSLIAHCTGYVPKELIISFGDLHIYRNHVEAVQTQLSRESLPYPSLVIHPIWQNTGFDGLTSIRWDDLDLKGYVSHPRINAPVAV